MDAAVQSFQRGSGWYLWNWKIQPGIGFEEWDVQRQLQLYKQSNGRKGIDPLRLLR